MAKDEPAKKATRKRAAKAADAPAKRARPKAAPAGPATDVVADAPGGAPAAPAAAPKAAPRFPGPVVRLLFPYDAYDRHKDAIKAQMKDAGLRFQFLGRGQGRYHSDEANVFARFGDDVVDYTLRGDAALVERLAASWRELGARDFTEEAKAEEEAAEVKAWRLEMPLRRPGEPESFFKKRLAEWEARKP